MATNNGVRVNVRNVRLKLDHKAIVAPGSPVHRGFMRAAGKTRDRAKQNLRAAGRIDTGRLLNSIAYEIHTVGNNIWATVGTSVEYAPFIHDGTANNGAGWIYPRRALFLRFTPKGGNAVVFAPRVRGIKATPFLKDAVDALTEADFE